MLHPQHHYPKQSTPMKNRHDDCVCLSASYIRYRVVAGAGIFIQWSDWNEWCRSRLDQDVKLLTSHCVPFAPFFLFTYQPKGSRPGERYPIGFFMDMLGVLSLVR